MAVANAIVVSVAIPDGATNAQRIRALDHARDFALQLKRRELRRGVGVGGRPLKPVKPESRPDGAKGPPLSPHQAESRSQKWLRASISHRNATVTLWWSHGWGRILGYHREGNAHLPARDVIGLTPADRKAHEAEMRRWWGLQEGRAKPPAPEPAPKPAPTPPRVPGLTPAQVAKIAALPRNARPLAYRDIDRPARPPAPKLFSPVIPGVKPPRPPATPRAKPPAKPKPKAAAEAPAPAPGSIAARLAAYTEGDRKVALMAEAAAPARAIRAERDRLRGLVEALLDRERATPYEDRKPVTAELRAMQAQYRVAYDAALAAERKHRAIALGILGRQPEGIEFDDARSPMAALAAGARDSAEGAANYVRMVAARGGLPGVIDLEWKDAEGGRAFSLGGMVVALDEGAPVATAVHELGHVLENRVPGWREKAVEYLRHRVGDEPNVLLNEALGPGYRDDERGRKDKFEAAFGHQAYYVGKDYGGYNTEITAMGLEKLFKDPLNFAAEDPEYCKFLLGMLDGGLR